jgi:uncharacterized membrane protein SpoIIM required for sporulation
VTEQAFIMRREASWKAFESFVSGSAKEIRAAADSFPLQFRELTQDLNTARSHGFDSAIVERLNILVNEGNQILYGQHDWSFKIAVNYLFNILPRKIRSQWRGFLSCLLLFYGLAIFSALVCIRFPDFVYELMSKYQAESLEEMYDPSSDYFLTPRDVESDADMFGYYIYNNVSITFRTFAGGIFAGIGSLFFLVFNAIYLGIVAGHIINKGFAITFFPFIIGHSSFELTAIILGAQAGLILGYRFFVPKGLSRASAIREAGKDALPLISGAALMDVVAAVIEAFWSSRFTLPLPLRLGAGLIFWILLFCYLMFAGRGKAAPSAKGADK